jgi:hypothetical protein
VNAWSVVRISKEKYTRISKNHQLGSLKRHRTKAELYTDSSADNGEKERVEEEGSEVDRARDGEATSQGKWVQHDPHEAKGSG